MKRFDLKTLYTFTFVIHVNTNCVCINVRY